MQSSHEVVPNEGDKAAAGAAIIADAAGKIELTKGAPTHA